MPAYFAQLAARVPDWVEARAAVAELLTEIGELHSEDRAWARRVLEIDENDEADVS